MSCPKLPIKTSRRAERDLQGILQYTEERWGLTQKQIYKEKLGTAFNTLCDTPLIGTRSDKLTANYRFLAVGSH